jgi:putative Holliday junction resolvase
VPTGRSVCLDVGERRVGIAVSDEEGRLASPLRVLERREAARDFERLAAVVREQRATRVVVGLPRTLAGEIGPQARRVQRWTARLAPYLQVPIVYWDERYSTAEAYRRLASIGRPRRPRAPIDAVAAAVILQEYLDSER